MRTTTLKKTGPSPWVCFIGAAAIVFDLGCGQTAPSPSSSSSGTNATDAAPSNTDAGTTGTGTVTSQQAPVEAGAKSTVDAGQTGVEDSDAGDGGTCAPSSTATFVPQAFVAAVAHQGLCTTAAIAAFVTACGDNATDTSCTAWTAANVAGEGGAGTACGNCVVSPVAKNNGAAWTDPEGYLSPNYGACIQVTDTTHGSACGAALNNASGCEAVACDNCDDYDDCASAADEGSCSSYVTTENSACTVDFEDGGVSDTCAPSETGGYDPDFTFIADLICGGGDAG